MTIIIYSQDWYITYTLNSISLKISEGNENYNIILPIVISSIRNN